MSKIQPLKKSERYLILFVFLGIGISLLIWGIFVFLDERQFVFEGIKTTGKVADFEKKYAGTTATGNKGSAFFPIVSFTSQNGEVVTFTSNSGANYYLYDVGEEVEVIYISSNPRQAKIYSFLSIWAYPFGLFFLALLFLFFDFMILWMK